MARGGTAGHQVRPVPAQRPGAGGVKDQPLGVDFIDINLIKKFEERGISWTDG